MINWNQMIGDTQLWEIVAALTFVTVFFAVALVKISRLAKDDADRLLFPKMGEVQHASTEKIDWWLCHLPEAKTEAEKQVIILIVDRAWELSLTEVAERADKAVEVLHQETLITEHHGQIV